MEEKEKCETSCEECGCSCGGHEDDEPILIDLDMDDGEKITAEVIGVFEYNEKEYIALADIADEEAPVLIYRFKALDDDNADLATIESDEEFEAVQKHFMELYFDDIDGIVEE